MEIYNKENKFSFLNHKQYFKKLILIKIIKIPIILSLFNINVAIADATADCNIGSGISSTECGVNSLASALNATSTGEDSIASSDFSTAIGTAASASVQSGTTAVGAGAITTTGTVIGSSSQAIGGDFAGGYFSNASGDSAVALGLRALATGDQTTALGTHAQSRSIGTVSLGHNANYVDDTLQFIYVNSANSIAIGKDSLVGFSIGGIAIGADAKVGLLQGGGNIFPAPNGIAIGNAAQSKAIGAISIGANVINDVPDSIKVEVPLRVENANGTAAIKVIETNTTSANRQLIDLENNGGIGMRMNNTNNGSVWDFSNTNSGNFTVSKVGTGGFEFEVQGNGRTKIKSQGTLNFDMRSNGNLIIPNGTVTATNYVTSSSKALKEDFSKVDQAIIMQKLDKLELSKWRYKDPEVKGHHIGPMAEEFYKLFELGPDNKHVVATDMASIALIASKHLKAENNELKNRLAVLEKLVTQLTVVNNNQKGIK